MQQFMGSEAEVDLSLTARAEGGRTVIEATGEIDVETAPQLGDKIAALVDEGSYDLVLDLERVEFLDSTGLGALIGGLKRVRNHDGSLSLVCTRERLLKLFRITGLTKVFDIHPDVASAI